MKKILALLTAAILLVSVFPFTASAAYTPMGPAEYEKYIDMAHNLDGWRLATQYYSGREQKKPMAGARFTESGLQLVSPEWTTGGYAALVTAEPIDITEGGTVTIRMNEFPDRSITDGSWLSFGLLQEPVIDHGKDTQRGLYTLVWSQTGTDSSPVIPHAEYWAANLDPKQAQVHLGNTNFDFVGTGSNDMELSRPNEEVTFSWNKTDAGYQFQINDCKTGEGNNLPTQQFKFLNNAFEGNKAYLVIAVFSVSNAPLSFTITDYNGKKPTGTTSVTPGGSIGKATEVMDPAKVPAGQPGLLFTPGTASSNPEYFSGDLEIVNNVWRITSTGATPQMSFWPSKMNNNVTTLAEAFPIIAFKARMLEGNNDTGEPRVYWASGSNVGYTSSEYMDLFYDFGEWYLFVLNLEEYTKAGGSWNGKINFFSFEFVRDQWSDQFEPDDHSGDVYELAWAGAFRTIADAEAYYDKTTDTPAQPGTTPEGGDPAGTDPVESTEPGTELPGTDVPVTDIGGENTGEGGETAAPGESGAATEGDGTEAAGTAAPGETTKGGTDKNDEGGFPWLIVVIAAVVVLAGGGCACFFLLKKKKAK